MSNFGFVLSILLCHLLFLQSVQIQSNNIYSKRETKRETCGLVWWNTCECFAPSFIRESGERSLKKLEPLGAVLHHLFSPRLSNVLMNSKKMGTACCSRKTTERTFVNVALQIMVSNGQVMLSFLVQCLSSLVKLVHLVNVFSWFTKCFVIWLRKVAK